MKPLHILPLLLAAAVVATAAYAGTINGTSRADNLVGSDSADVINGRGGNDTIEGRAGPDQLVGGPATTTSQATVSSR